ncbi:MAG: flagellar basal body P-ring formation chaperone FlgA [Limnobacter sp.]|nr:flagellar basal body P-ring formation chaperone FlgA [Limnobacter sp.]
MLKKTLGLFFIFLTGTATADSADQWVTQDSLDRLVNESALPMGAIVETEVITQDDRLSSAHCPAALFSNSESRKAWGKTLLKVQCLGSEVAPFFVHVDFKVWAPVLVVKEQVQRGDSIGDHQVEFRTMNVAQLKQGWVTDLTDLHNKTASRPLWPGTTISHDVLTGRPLLQYGDTVKIMVQGPGFQIAGSGTALERAEKGDVVKIKTAQGKVLHGVAVGDLLVEVTL